MAAAANSLPRYFALSRFDLFFEYIHHEDVAAHGLFISQGDQVLSPFTKLELVDAGGNGRAHIRFCYNNKFLAIQSEDDHRISAVADEPVEDPSAWSCTMFVVDPVGSMQSRTMNVRFEHVHLGGSLTSRSVADRTLRVEPGRRNLRLHDVSSMLARNLPRFVGFKGNNGNFGRLLSNNNVDFRTPGNNWHVNIVHEMLPPDGSGLIRIKNLGNNRCWRSTHPGGSILVDTASDRPDLPAGHIWFEGSFDVHRVGDYDDDAVALSMRSFLMRDPRSQLLTDAARTIDVPEARLVMEEAVRSWEIYDVRFHLLTARIIMGDPSLTTQTMRNETSREQIYEGTFTYSETKTSSWNAIVSVTRGVSVNIKAGIPFLLKGKINISAEVSAAYEWGREYENKVEKSDTYRITAPPMTIVSVSRFESQGSYDIPFSYTREDILWDGRRVLTRKDDGLYIGANNFDIYYEVTEERIILPSSSDTTTTTTAPQLKEEEDVRRRVYRILPQSSRVVQQPNNDHPSSAPPAESVPVPAAPG